MKKNFVIVLMFFSSFSSFAQTENHFNELDSSLVNLIIDFGKTYEGTRYKYGACDSRNGFDCSGFIYYMFKMAGFSLPRSSRDIGTIGESVDLLNVKKGDLLFFNTLSSGRISHVGIVSKASKDEIIMLHVSSTQGVQEVDIISSDYWYARFVMAKKMIN